ncbi:MAG: 1,4-alpha-glucan branching enzyme [Alphaproteobacteria bacterium]|jgi:1,4-alpha-glucan branching enzyme|nr:1,4-alpha-glucan branching enzyme [Alphaproteobacteria bacterium]
MTALSPEAYAIIEGRHSDPFHYLGLHVEDDVPVVRAFLPDAAQVAVVDEQGHESELDRIHDAGLFAGHLANGSRRYRLRARYGEQVVELEDPYRFPPVLTEFDLYLLSEGTHLHLYDKLGAHPLVMEGVPGVAFAVFAPDARRVSVVGDFNFWDGRRHPMRVRANGFWEIFIPNAAPGDKYKYEIVSSHGGLLPLKSDPVAFGAELRPGTASIVVDLNEVPRPEPLPPAANDLGAPISIYEVHLGSWRRSAEEGGRWLTYREMAEVLPAYLKDMGFTHVEFLPVSEHPFDGSWGYQPTGLFAPTSRFGTPADFAALVEACHRAGVAVLLDWVPGHFPDDPHGLARFDGTALYEHANPMQGRHLDWGTLIYNFGRTEVANFLLANALFWFDRYRVDGLRVDAVASMLYLDYSRPAGGWIPNKHGGRENLDAVAFLRRFNSEVYSRYPDATTAAEESTAWPMVSKPVDWGGLGFGYKWNMGWMHDTLDYISKDPIHRKHHHGQILFGLHYAFFENFILPLSHDEVVHGKRSILGRMPGDDWQRFANLRAYYAFMFAHPGKKLMFMGNEFGQQREWNHDRSLDWHLLDQPRHAGIQSLVRDLNRLYRTLPALHQLDCDSAGFEWLVMHDADRSVFAWLRKGRETRDRCLVVVNFTPQVYRDYRIPVPFAGIWREVLNTDAAIYGGSDVGNAGEVRTLDEGAIPEVSLAIPPLAAIFLVPEQ